MTTVTRFAAAEMLAVPVPPTGAQAGLRAAAARVIFHQAARRSSIAVRWPNGSITGSPAGPRLMLRNPASFFRRVGASGLIGFGEAYMAGDWDAPDLSAVLTGLAGQMAQLVPASLQQLRSSVLAAQPKSAAGSAANAAGNVAHHYDLSNELFASFLDETLSYSSAVFTDPASAGWADLAGAQQVKIDRLLDLAGVGRGTRLLEIGTGWGELCIRAASRGASVRSITLSRQQLQLAAARVAAAGHAGSVEIELCDYRAVTGHYDAIVSVEMIEAVGYQHWPEYFQTLDRLLAPAGKAALQAITMPHDRMLASRDTYTWIQKYIFPGGLLPSLTAISETAADCTDLRVTRVDSFGQHYVRTLQLWRERFRENTQTVAELGFDERFQRMWDFYLAYSEAGFRSRYLDVCQLLLQRPGRGAVMEGSE